MHSPFGAVPGALSVQVFKKTSHLDPKILEECLGGAQGTRCREAHEGGRAQSRPESRGRTLWGTVQCHVPGEEPLGVSGKPKSPALPAVCVMLFPSGRPRELLFPLAPLSALGSVCPGRECCRSCPHCGPLAQPGTTKSPSLGCPLSPFSAFQSVYGGAEGCVFGRTVGR